MLLCRQPGDTGVFATATPTRVAIYNVNRLPKGGEAAYAPFSCDTTMSSGRVDGSGGVESAIARWSAPLPPLHTVLLHPSIHSLSTGAGLGGHYATDTTYLHPQSLHQHQQHSASCSRGLLGSTLHSTFGSGSHRGGEPTSLSLSCATDRVCFFLSDFAGSCWIGSDTSPALSPLQIVSRGRGGGGRTSTAVTGASAVGGEASGRGGAGRDLRMDGAAATATGQNPATALWAPLSHRSDEEDYPSDDLMKTGDGSSHQRHHHPLESNTAAAFVPSQRIGRDPLTAGVMESGVTSPPATFTSSLHRAPVVTASCWDPRNAMILALGRQDAVVQLLDVEYLLGGAGDSTGHRPGLHTASTTSSFGLDESANTHPQDDNGLGMNGEGVGGADGLVEISRAGTPHTTSTAAAGTSTGGGARAMRCSIVHERHVKGPVTAMDWVPMSRLTVVAARRQDDLGYYAELLDLRAPDSSLQHLGAAPDEFATFFHGGGAGRNMVDAGAISGSAYANLTGGSLASPSVLCYAEVIACDPSATYVATVGAQYNRDVVQLWDLRKPSRPLVQEVYTKAGYTSLCWSLTEPWTVLGTTAAGELRVHTFLRGGGTSGASLQGNNTFGDCGTDGGDDGCSSGRSRSRGRNNNSGAAASAIDTASSDGATHAFVGAGTGGAATVTSATTTTTTSNNAMTINGSFQSALKHYHPHPQQQDGGVGGPTSSLYGVRKPLFAVSMKTISAKGCRLPSRVPAAAVAWMPCTSHRKQPSRPGDGKGNTDGGASSLYTIDPISSSGAVMGRGCRTDLPRLLVMNCNDGELYTQVYNRRGSTVAMFDGVPLVAAGPNVFSVITVGDTVEQRDYVVPTPTAASAAAAMVVAGAGAVSSADAVTATSSVTPSPPSQSHSASPRPEHSDRTTAWKNGEDGNAKALRVKQQGGALKPLLHTLSSTSARGEDVEGEKGLDDNSGQQHQDGSYHGEAAREEHFGSLHHLYRRSDRSNGSSSSSSDSDRHNSDISRTLSSGSIMSITKKGLISGSVSSTSSRSSNSIATHSRTVSHPPSYASAVVVVPHLASKHKTRRQKHSSSSSPPQSTISAEALMPHRIDGLANVDIGKLGPTCNCLYAGQRLVLDRSARTLVRLRLGFSSSPLACLPVLLKEGEDREAFALFRYGRLCARQLFFPHLGSEDLYDGEEQQLEEEGGGDDGAASLPHHSTNLALVVAPGGASVPSLLHLLRAELKRLRQAASVAAAASSSGAGEGTSSAYGNVVSGALDTASEEGSNHSGHRQPHQQQQQQHAGGMTALSLLMSGAERLAAFPLKPHSTSAGLTIPLGGMMLPLPGNRRHTAPIQKIDPSAALALAAADGGAGGGKKTPTPVSSASTRGSGGTAASGATEKKKLGAASAAAAAAGEEGVLLPATALRSMILRSMGWQSTRSSTAHHLVHEVISDDRLSSISAASHGGGGVSGESHGDPSKYFVEGDGIGMAGLQEAVERRVAVLVLLGQLGSASELLALYASCHPLYPALALELSACKTAAAAAAAATQRGGSSEGRGREGRGVGAGANALVPPSVLARTAGCTFWLALVFTFVDEMGQGGSAFVRASTDGVLASRMKPGEQPKYVLSLLQRFKALPLPDRIALAAALLLPTDVEVTTATHLGNLVQVLEYMVGQQYEPCTCAVMRPHCSLLLTSVVEDSPPAGVVTTATGTPGGSALATALSQSLSILPPGTAGGSNSGAATAAASNGPMLLAGSVSACGLLAPLQRYVDESGDLQTPLCYVAAFGPTHEPAYHLWKEGYKSLLNCKGLYMLRCAHDLCMVKTSQARIQGDCGVSGMTAGGSSLMGRRDSRVASPPSSGGSAGRTPNDMGPGSPTRAFMAANTMMAHRFANKSASPSSSSTLPSNHAAAKHLQQQQRGATTMTAASYLDPRRPVELRCDCGQAMHATAVCKGGAKKLEGGDTMHRPLPPCGNPDCKEWQTPMCTVCGERMEARAMELPPERFFVWCTVCLHGGHLCHLREWHAKHSKCAVEDCPCRCCDGIIN